MGIMKGFTFDGIRSLDYYIGMTGSTVYNSPERDVEMVEIPGRNGAYALDHKRFRNIPVEYPSSTFDTSQPNFAEKISDFRNALASRTGYKRIEDEYNPDEYRMGVYTGGLDVVPVASGKAGEFSILFDCMPQRFLKSGETAVSIESGDELINPTLFESHPLLEAYGYGKINLGSETVNILTSQDVGNVVLANAVNFNKLVFDSSILNTGDSFTIGSDEMYGVISSFKIETTGGNLITNIELVEGEFYGVTWIPTEATTQQKFARPNLDFVKGTPKTLTARAIYAVTATIRSITLTVDSTLTYDGDGTITIMTDTSQYTTGYTYYNSNRIPEAQYIGEADGYSTKQTGGNPTYIDLDIGEAYKIENGNIIALNRYTEIPAELPTLKPGANEITYDNTITALDITPRWWKI